MNINTMLMLILCMFVCVWGGVWVGVCVLMLFDINSCAFALLYSSPQYF